MSEPLPALTDADAVLERRIWRWRMHLVEADCADARRFAAAKMGELIRQRRPEQVEHLERARGLRA